MFLSSNQVSTTTAKFYICKNKHHNITFQFNEFSLANEKSTILSYFADPRICCGSDDGVSGVIIHPISNPDVSALNTSRTANLLVQLQIRSHWLLVSIFTVRSCGKVIFSEACVKNSVHREGGGGVCLSACWDTPPWTDTPPGQTPLGRLPGQTPPSRRTVRILLECILVSIFRFWEHFSNRTNIYLTIRAFGNEKITKSSTFEKKSCIRFICVFLYLYILFVPISNGGRTEAIVRQMKRFGV